MNYPTEYVTVFGNTKVKNFQEQAYKEFKQIVTNNHKLTNEELNEIYKLHTQYKLTKTSSPMAEIADLETIVEEILTKNKSSKKYIENVTTTIENYFFKTYTPENLT